MAEPKIADRHRWALDMLAVDPSDRILEIGCGNGSMAALICGCLTDGTITAVDRSVNGIREAEIRNAESIARGKARFVAASVHEADFDSSLYDKAFAVNVNLFWMKADRELAAVRKLLKPEGTLYLFNQPPAADKIDSIADATSRNLTKAGFAVLSVVVGEQRPVPVLGVIAKP